MTTEIIVNAHCSDDTEVVISTYEEEEKIDEIVIKNGDSESFYVYDEKIIQIKEQEQE